MELRIRHGETSLDAAKYNGVAEEALELPGYKTKLNNY